VEDEDAEPEDLRKAPSAEEENKANQSVEEENNQSVEEDNNQNNNMNRIRMIVRTPDKRSRNA
jgi:hypothetical protein